MEFHELTNFHFRNLMERQLDRNVPVSRDNSVCETHSVNDEHDNNELKHVAPDGGWGWVVCAACFMSHVLTDGIQYSFGVVFVELLDYYKGSKGETAIVASISAGICCLSGKVLFKLVIMYIYDVRVV